MYPKKGIIMEGADADVVVWNPKATVGGFLQPGFRLNKNMASPVKITVMLIL